MMSMMIIRALLALTLVLAITPQSVLAQQGKGDERRSPPTSIVCPPIDGMTLEGPSVIDEFSTGEMCTYDADCASKPDCPPFDFMLLADAPAVGVQALFDAATRSFGMTSGAGSVTLAVKPLKSAFAIAPRGTLYSGLWSFPGKHEGLYAIGVYPSPDASARADAVLST
jgi:hypothetical protein